jgi:hypothetical protein
MPAQVRALAERIEAERSGRLDIELVHHGVAAAHGPI